MLTAEQVVKTDLEAITDRAAEEFSALAGSRLLITGGAGFLGHYLVQAAAFYNTLGRGAPIDITVYDSYARGVPGWLKALEGHDHVTLVKHDMRHPLPADRPAFDWIIHAATIASPTYYRKDPIGTMDANVNGLRAILDDAKARIDAGNPHKGILYFSTSEIYGNPDAKNIPTPETYQGLVSCTGPRACYDEGKRFGETLCVNFAAQHGVQVKTARPFNNYGPGLKITDRRVLPDFARDIFAGRDIVMLSDGSPTRTFCYVSDAVAGYYKVLVRGEAGEPYNIGVEKPEISMRALADKVAAIGREQFGYKGKVVVGKSDDTQYLIDNPNRRCPIIGKAREALGYDPVVTVDEGLLRSMIWYSENQQAEDL